jgi:regulator of protease activity HflC (stomatin/prohibitin superfamily)
MQRYPQQVKLTTKDTRDIVMAINYNNIVMWYILGAGVLFILLFPIYIVPQNYVAIIETLGKYSQTTNAGLNIKIPFLQKVASKIYLGVLNRSFELDAVTKDKVLVTIKANLTYSIDYTNVTKYYYGLRQPDKTMVAYVENYTRSFVAQETHEQMLERREEITDYLLKHLSEKLLEYGIKIHGFQIMDIVFPTEITDAMSRVVASQRLKEAALNEAEAKKIRVVKQAEADKDASVLRGEGIAGEREAIIRGLEDSIDEMRKFKDVSTQDIMDFIMETLKLDVMKQIGASPNTKVLFTDTDYSGKTGKNDLIQAIVSANEASKDSKK